MNLDPLESPSQRRYRNKFCHNAWRLYTIRQVERRFKARVIAVIFFLPNPDKLLSLSEYLARSRAMFSTTCHGAKRKSISVFYRLLPKRDERGYRMAVKNRQLLRARLLGQIQYFFQRTAPDFFTVKRSFSQVGFWVNRIGRPQ